MANKLQETLDELGKHVRGECGQTKPDNSQAIKYLATKASAELELSYQEQYTEQAEN